MRNTDKQIQATITYYDTNADRFWEGTKDHDVPQNISALISNLPKTKPLKILDLGCGPGRDIQSFKSMGHDVVGLDASYTFCQMAAEYTGCSILHQEFEKMNLEPESFHGIFANASLFHVSKSSLNKVLKDLHAALKANGVLFSSSPRGNTESFDGNRYGNYMEFEEYESFLTKAGFKVLTHYYRPAGKPLDQQPWLAVVSGKQANS
jgi:2-polyprenyl-3-methyl-5-hydroxy-6-metoxy-1,4-benzoquinol methylase